MMVKMLRLMTSIAAALGAAALLLLNGREIADLAPEE